MSKKKKEKKEDLSFFERRQEIFNSGGTSHQVFVNVLEHQKITEHTEKGIRVLVARYPDFYKIYFHSYMPPGSCNFPRGGVKVWNATDDQMQCFYIESVALHPDGGQYKFYNKEDDE